MQNYFCKISIKLNGIAKLENKLLSFCHASFKPERLVNTDIIPGTSLPPSKSLEIDAYLTLSIYWAHWNNQWFHSAKAAIIIKNIKGCIRKSSVTAWTGRECQHSLAEG